MHVDTLFFCHALSEKTALFTSRPSQSNFGSRYLELKCTAFVITWIILPGLTDGSEIDDDLDAISKECG